MEWMRCNLCWLQVKTKKLPYYLTQCGHLYCSACISKAEKKCFQCNSVGSISLTVTEPLNPLIAHYFTPTVNLYDKIIQSKQFQDSQKSLIFQRLSVNESKYQAVKEAYFASAENLKKVFQKYNHLKMTINKRAEESKIALAAYANLSQHRIPADSQYRTPSSLSSSYIGRQSSIGTNKVSTIRSGHRPPDYYIASPSMMSSCSSNHNQMFKNFNV